MDPLLKTLADHADAADARSEWPTASWELLTRLGGLRWCIPAEDGGDGLHGVELQEKYRSLAAACLTTSFLLSQRDAACRRLRDSDNTEMRRTLLPALARGEAFITVGLSQLTTSRQHVGPSLSARWHGNDLILDGTIPWVTGAAHARHLVVGAVLEDGLKVVFVMPTDLPGVVVEAPLDLMALGGSLTATVRCENVRVPRSWLLEGPAERVLQGLSGSTGGLETSCLALGLAQAALAYLHEEAHTRPGLASIAERLQPAWNHTWQELCHLAVTAGTPEAALALRGRANTLVLQTTQAALTAGKGTAFVRPHPAQRWARQALFFLVWSCPWPAAEATLAYLTGGGASECS